MVFNCNHGFVMVFACGIPQRFDFKQHCGNVVNMIDTQLGDAVYRIPLISDKQMWIL